MLTMSFAAALLSVACVSPSGAYRELRSDRHAPTASDLEGTGRFTPVSAADAAATGLSLGDVRTGFITFRRNGTCTADLFDDPCGLARTADSPPRHRTPAESCHWSIRKGDEPTILLTFGDGNRSSITEVHRLEANPPLLWQYICDPDLAEYVEFRREGTR
jgi:hypothetical protein